MTRKSEVNKKPQVAKNGKSDPAIRRSRRLRGKIKVKSGLGKAWDFHHAQTIRMNKPGLQRIEAQLRKQALAERLKDVTVN